MYERIAELGDVVFRYGCRLSLEGIVSKLLCCEQPELAALPILPTVGALKLQHPLA
jgi:hypothetical protein